MEDVLNQRHSDGIKHGFLRGVLIEYLLKCVLHL